MQVNDVLNDLLSEQAALDEIVDGMEEEAWDASTPSPRWSVGDQIGHLTYFDRTAALAITDPEAFADHRSELMSSAAGDEAMDELTLGEFRQLSPADRLTAWRHGRLDLEAAARTLSDDSRVEWYGPSMSAKSFLTARLMEVWAHGQDICDTIDVSRGPTDRLRHIAQLGVITRGWSYTVRGQQAPDVPVRVQLAAPSGDTWAWGPDDAAASVRGDAADFCLVVTQRRHVDDTALEITGDAATEWMSRAQAFAGGPTTGPEPKGRS